MPEGQKGVSMNSKRIWWRILKLGFLVSVALLVFCGGLLADGRTIECAMGGEDAITAFEVGVICFLFAFSAGAGFLMLPAVYVIRRRASSGSSPNDHSLFARASSVVGFLGLLRSAGLLLVVSGAGVLLGGVARRGFLLTQNLLGSALSICMGGSFLVAARIG